MQEIAELITNEANVSMQIEIALMLLLFLLPLFRLKKNGSFAVWWGLLFTVFLYLHRTILPFIVSGIYIFGIFFLLYPTVSSLVSGKRCRTEKKIFSGTSIIGGYGLWIIFCAALSLLGFAGNGFIYAAATVLIYVLFIFRMKKCGGIRHIKELMKKNADKKLLFIIGIILIALLIQLNRINIAIDYDSLHYGLRSEYILADGRWGIFEDHGLVNTVYTYPKGFEILTLGLSFLPSYSFTLCANIFILAVILFAAGRCVYLVIRDRHTAFFAAMVLSLIPGITNMALTAKSDLLTLLFQILAVCFIMKGITGGGERAEDGDGRETAAALLNAVSALILSFTGKPTAAVFSTGLFIASAIFLVRKRKELFSDLNMKIKVPDAAGTAGAVSMRDSIGALAISLVTFFIICARTFILTGLPITSVFSGIFTRLGFELKYPFGLQEIPSEGISLGFFEGLKNTFIRIIKFLVFPEGEDMSHVIMAWGGLFFVALLFVFIFEKRASEKYISKSHGAEARAGFEYMSLISFTMIALAVVSLHLLWQVDGNYFMLMYCLVSMAAVLCIYSVDRIVSGSGGTAWFHEKLRNAAVMFFTAAMIFITAHTGWAGAVGFTPVRLINPGFFDHEEIIEGLREDSGSDEIWRELNEACESGEKRIIAFEKDPFCYSFLSAVESYTDIEGSGGNVYLVKKLNIFKEYLTSSDIDFIYVDTSYLLEDGRDRARSLVHDLIEDGTLVDLKFNESLEGESIEEKESFIRERGLTKFYGRIDKERAGEKWEIPLSDEKKAAAEAETGLYEAATDAAKGAAGSV